MAGEWAHANKRKNDLYWKQVRSAIAGFSRASINVMAASTYTAAVVATWQDSGRAAHNWRMAAGAHVDDMSVDIERNKPPVGKSHEQRSSAGMGWVVMGERLKEYTITHTSSGVSVSGWVSDQIGDPMERKFYGKYPGAAAARYGSVTIYNPIGDNMGSYPERAFELHGSVREAINKAQTIAFDVLQRELNRGKKTPAQMHEFVVKLFGGRR